jgi:hypothetical protein
MKEGRNIEAKISKEVPQGCNLLPALQYVQGRSNKGNKRTRDQRNQSEWRKNQHAMIC